MDDAGLRNAVLHHAARCHSERSSWVNQCWVRAGSGR